MGIIASRSGEVNEGERERERECECFLFVSVCPQQHILKVRRTVQLKMLWKLAGKKNVLNQPCLLGICKLPKCFS